MFRIKRLYTFIIETFLPVFFATFGVCLFIVLMQFLFQFVDDLVGKGIGIELLGKMFFHAALSFVPLALPLAILLASLITFGNLGERLELLAMKASGISLLQIMRPMILLICFVSIGVFFFQNDVLPQNQVKLKTLLRSIKLKSPELNIPEKTFYKGIEGYNLYVNKRDMKTGVMYDLMIYDFSKRFDNAKVYVADSGKISSSTDKKYLVFTMYSGVSFENLRDVNRYPRDEKVPYLRESFSMKEILIAFDANFKMEDESHMQNRDLSKNLKQLGSYIDSASVVADSLDNQVVKMLKKGFYSQALFSPSQVEKEQEQSQSEESKDLYTYYDEKTDVQKQSVLTSAKSKAATVRSELYYNKDMQTGRNAPLIGHKIEWHKKIAISFACLVFLFIGAPLGAIIRKGGIGMPTVVSVFLFLFYYSIDMLGLKLAKQDVVPVWLGMWLSPIVLFSLGLFFTYKAVNDSIMFNVDAWMALFKRLIGKKETRNYQKKEVIMYSPDYTGCLNKLRKLTTDSEDFQKQINKNPGYISFWNKDIFAPVDRISQDMENLIEELRNSEYNLIIAKLMDYPVFSAMQTSLMRNKKIRTICAYVFPIGIVVYLYNLYKIKGVKEDIALLIRVNGELSVEIEKKINKD